MVNQKATIINRRDVKFILLQYLKRIAYLLRGNSRPPCAL